MSKHELKDRVQKRTLIFILLFSFPNSSWAIAGLSNSGGYTKIQPPSSAPLTLVSLAPELKPIQLAPERSIKTVKPAVEANKTAPTQAPDTRPLDATTSQAITAQKRRQVWLKIQFAPGSAWLHPKYHGQINQVADQLASLETNSPLKAIIEGSVGLGVSEEIARKLSAARAQVLEKAILGRNPALASRLEVRALGVSGTYLDGKLTVDQTSQTATLRISH